jgi:hypothetical protein
MRPSDLFTRLLLCLIAGTLFYIAGCLRVLVRQTETYAAQPAAQPPMQAVSWRGSAVAPPQAEPARVYVAGYVTTEDGGRNWMAHNFREDGRNALPIKAR